jgi:predicted short-subunit dehydrogenase-like oxidoreductase (DUF2520 family)
MFHRIRIIGRGRLGSALAARLESRGHTPCESDPDLIVLTVPDAVIAKVAEAQTPGPWLCHMSGATPLAACAPHTRRFGLHPLQTFRRDGGPEQFDGSWGAISAETAEARAGAAWLARELGLQTFELDEAHRALYHLGATLASNYLVTLYRLAARAFEKAGAPTDALLPLMRRTIDNGFDLTGPIARGDRVTIDMHLQALRDHMADAEMVYQALAAATAKDLQPSETRR